ncbi:MAG: hypothetical protein Q7S21_06330 [archaeon]|nr:hypothetical protein [archaeon]
MSKELKIESRLLLGAWGNQIRKAASNPNAIVVIVLPIIFPEIKSDWVRSRLRRLVDFAKREFGDRAFTFVGTIDPKELRFQIKKRGFVFDRGIFGSRFHGKSFGQYLELCVKEETELMAKAARVPKRSIKMVPELSLEYEKKRKKPKSLRIRRR